MQSFTTLIINAAKIHHHQLCISWPCDLWYNLWLSQTDCECSHRRVMLEPQSVDKGPSGQSQNPHSDSLETQSEQVHFSHGPQPHKNNISFSRKQRSKCLNIRIYFKYHVNHSESKIFIININQLWSYILRIWKVPFFTKCTHQLVQRWAK